MITKHRTNIVFWTSLVFSCVSVLVVLFYLERMLPVLVFSIGLNVWAIAKSEQTGFVKTSQARRAYEPPRHFNIFQVFSLLFFTMAQIGVGVFVLIID